MQRLDLLRELVGDANSDYIATDLKQTYNDLQKDYDETNDDIDRVPIWSYEKEEELQKIEEMMSALEIVHSYYSTGVIDE